MNIQQIRRVQNYVAGMLAGLVMAGGLWSAPPAVAARCETVKDCISQLQFGESRSAREHAAAILGERGDASAIPHLVAALQGDQGEFVRANAAEAIGRIGGAAALKPLQDTMANEQRPLVRQRAARALGKLKVAGALETLGGILKNDKEWIVRRAAARGLGDLGQAQGATLLGQSLLSDGRSEVRIAAANNLAKLAQGGEAELIQSLQNDKDYLVRVAVAAALGSVTGDSSAKALLETSRKDQRMEVRQKSVESLGGRREAQAVEVLIRVVQYDPDLTVRLQAARELARIGGKRGREALEYYKDHAELREIRRAAGDALEDFAPDEPVQPKAEKKEEVEERAAAGQEGGV